MANASQVIEVPKGLLEDIHASALDNGMTPSELIAKVMQAFLDAEDRAAIEDGWRDADEGKFVEHDEMLRRLEKLRLEAIKAA